MQLTITSTSNVSGTTFPLRKKWLIFPPSFAREVSTCMQEKKEEKEEYENEKYKHKISLDYPVVDSEVQFNLICSDI